jgi:thioredoxin-like negative regulator of GroEL
MESFNKQEQIRAWAAGELPAEESKQLLGEAQNSPELRDEMDFSRKLNQVLQNRDMMEVGAILAGIAATEPLPAPVDPPSTGSAGGSWFTGAILITVLAIGGFFVGRQQGWWFPAPAQLASNYLRPMENVINTKESSMTVDDLRLGMEAYDRQDYPKAIERLSRFYQKAQDPHAGLFLGVAYLLEKQAAQALPILSNTVSKTKGPEEEAARWYLALAQLQTGASEQAQSTLKLIPADGLFGPQAQKLLQDLE